MPLTGGPPVGFPMTYSDDFGYVPPARPRPQPIRQAPQPYASRPQPQRQPQWQPQPQRQPQPRPAAPARPAPTQVAQRPVEVPTPDELGIQLDPDAGHALVIPSPDDLGIDPN